MSAEPPQPAEVAGAAAKRPSLKESDFSEIGRDSHGANFTTYINPASGNVVCHEMFDFLSRDGAA